jgi:alpha-L-fucosidase
MKSKFNTIAKVIAIFALLPVIARSFAEDAADAQHANIGMVNIAAVAKESSPVDAKWFADAGLGLFVHFGIASVGGRQDLSWAMIKNAPFNAQNHGVLTPNAYYYLAKQFHPATTNFNKWLKAAKDAGFGYVVLTTRHHDGFALWPSDYGELSTKNYMGGQDIVKEFVESCHKHNLKIGFYYSSPDWYRERDYKSWGFETKGTSESPHLDMNHQLMTSLPPFPADFAANTGAYINGQLRELLTRYGPIDYLWFDGSQKGVMSQAEIRKMQPAILINDRQHGSGDVMTARYEGGFPSKNPQFLWEHCFSMVGAWGYTKPVHCKPAEIIIEKLARSRTWGGNVLANFGPQPNGDMPPEYYQCLNDLKSWMDWAAPAVVGVQSGLYPEKCSAPVTISGDNWFVFLLPKKTGDTNMDENIILKAKGSPKSIIGLRTGVTFVAKADVEGFSIQVPKSLRTDSVDILKIEWEHR